MEELIKKLLIKLDKVIIGNGVVRDRSVIFKNEELTKNKNMNADSCTSIGFKNLGDERITINDYPLEVGSAMLIHDCNEGEYNVTNYWIRFAGGGSNPKLGIQRKYYTDRSDF